MSNIAGFIKWSKEMGIIFFTALEESTNVTSLDEEDEILFEANRLLMNFLAMCFSYVEHIKHRIFEQYGGKRIKDI